MYSTSGTIIDQARNETGIGTNPIGTSLQVTDMLRRLEDLNREFVNYPYTVGAMGWSFLARERIIETKASTSLNGAIAKSATSLILTDASGFDNPDTIEAGYIKSSNGTFDFFTYEEKSTNTLTDVDGIDMAHSDESVVHKIYKLPSDFGKIRAILRDKHEYCYDDDDFSQVPKGNIYYIKHLSNDNHQESFIVFRENVGILEFKMHYIKEANTISDESDMVDAPDGFGRRFLVEKMKEYIWNCLGEDNDAVLALNRATNAINSAMSQWSTQTVQTSQSLYLRW